MPIEYCGLQSKGDPWRHTGIRAFLTVREGYLTAQEGAASAAWVCLKSPARDDQWLQMGFARYLTGSDTRLEAYSEQPTVYLGSVTAGQEYLFTIQRQQEAPHTWMFLLDNVPMGPVNHPARWRPNELTTAQFFGEAQEGSATPGSTRDPCVFRDCQVQIGFGTWKPVDFYSNFEAVIDGRDHRNLEIKSASRFEIDDYENG